MKLCLEHFSVIQSNSDLMKTNRSRKAVIFFRGAINGAGFYDGGSLPNEEPRKGIIYIYIVFHWFCFQIT